MKYKILLFISIGIMIAIFFVNVYPTFQSSEERRDKVISELHLAIQAAEEEGTYKCCIEPACTMCYLNANKWNYGEAGKCYCDDFIAKGEEPCPQCKRGIEEGLCKSTEEKPCDTSGDVDFKSAFD